MKAKTFDSARPSTSIIQSLRLWLGSENTLCSSLMEERVTHSQVLRVLAMFFFLTLAIFATASSMWISVLFLVIAALLGSSVME